MTLAALISSKLAAFKFLNDLKCFISAFFRTGPSPATSSRMLAVMPLPRSSRWKVIAKRWASSRTCFTRYSDAEPEGSTTGPVSCQGTNSSSSRLARPQMAMSSIPISSNMASAAVSCGFPPSRMMRSGLLPKRSSFKRAGA